MNDNSFNINFRKLAIEWLPTFLRSPLIVAFSFLLIAPLERLYIEFLKIRIEHINRMQHNFQKFSLQKRLNDVFDVVERRIEIVSAIRYNGVFLYTKAEDDAQHTKTKWLYGDTTPIYLRTKAELSLDFDFIVEIPDTGIDQEQLKAEIEYYMLQSKKYRIEIV